MKKVFLYFDLQHYSASDYAQYVWGEILDVSFAVPVDSDGRSVFAAVIEKRRGFLMQRDGFLVGESLTLSRCRPDARYSTLARTFDYGDTETAGNGDVIDLRHCSTIFVAFFSGYFDYINWLREELPNARIILVQDDSVEEFQYSRSDLQHSGLSAIRKANGMITYQDEMQSLAEVLCDKVLKVHHPMHPTFSPKRSTDRVSGLICIGVGCWNYDLMNLLTAVAVFSRVRAQLGPHVQGEFLGVHEYQRDEYAEFLSKERIALRPWRRHAAYYDAIGSYDVVLNLNGRAVAGRVSAEAALLGTPVVGNEAADMQSYCWPHLSVNRFDAAGSSESVLRLMCDDQYRRDQLALAARQIHSLKDEYLNYRPKIEGFFKCAR